MRFNKNIAIILVLVSLLLSALIFSFYLYNENKKTIAKNNQRITIYVAKTDIKKNSIIKEEDLSKTVIAKQFLLNKPLTKEEILGKITKEKLYKNEIFIKEKLTTKLEREKAFLLDYKYSSYNMPFNLFQNPNYTLNPNDKINIISVYVKENTKIRKDETSQYNVQYIASNINILGFIRDGKASDKTIEKKVIEVVNKKKKVEKKEVEIKASEIVLDIPNKVLLNLLNDYNKGKQLWMSKAKVVKKEEVTKPSKKETPKKVLKKVKTKTYYPIVWYKPTNKYIIKTATIEYANDPKLKSSQTQKIINSLENSCSQRDKLLIVKNTSANIRNRAYIGNNIHKTVSKNYILPYKSKSGVWYKLCDDRYVHKNIVNKISYKDIYKK